MADTFDDFMRERVARRNDAPPFDAEGRLNEWLGHLRDLYALVDNALAPYIESKDITVEYIPKSMNERSIGRYNADQLLIRFGDDTLFADPVGTMLIACLGRVDLSGPAGNLRLVYLEHGGPAVRSTLREGDSYVERSSSPVRGAIDGAGWYIATRPPSVTVVPLTEETFREAAMELIGD